MAFRQYNSAQVADIITDWHTDDDLADEEEQDDEEDFQPVLVAARAGNGRRTLGSYSDSSESSETSDSDSDIANTHTGSTTAGNTTLLGRDKTVWKSVQLQLLEERLLTMCLRVQVAYQNKFRNLLLLHMTLGSTSFLKVFFARLPNTLLKKLTEEEIRTFP